MLVRNLSANDFGLISSMSEVFEMQSTDDMAHNSVCAIRVSGIRRLFTRAVSLFGRQPRLIQRRHQRTARAIAADASAATSTTGRP